MTDQQQTPEPPIKVNIKVDAVEPVVERIAGALDRIAASLESMGWSLGTIEEKCEGIELIGRDWSAEDSLEHAEPDKPSTAEPIGTPPPLVVRLEDENW